MSPRANHILRIGAAGILVLCTSHLALAQLNENCTVSVLNRTVRVNPDGSWVLPNIPANFGQVKARATCVQNGVTIFGESAFFSVPANGVVNLPEIVLGATTPIPVSLIIAPTNLSFTSAGQTTQLLVTASYPDNSTRDVTAAGTGTNYTTSNPILATISADGRVTAVASGTVVIQATNDGAAGIITANVVLSSTDTDGDGIPDDVEITLGLDPRNPVDAQEDFDRDGLTNLQEYQLGTGIRNADSDGDGLSDGDEVNNYHSNPLLADTDGDGVPDGVEVQTSTNPLDRNSYDLKKATASSVVQPPSFVLTTSVLFPNVSTLLNWKVNLIDGKTTLDLTADPRTNYSSSDINVCNFGAQRGRIFAGSPGNCIITISNGTLAVTVPGTVQSFTPAPLSFVTVPGTTNNVDVQGNYAYVAAGAEGLQIVDVMDRSHPHIVASQALPGAAKDVVVSGNYAYVACGGAGLTIVNISNPLSPVLTGSLNVGGDAQDVMVKGNRAYVANGTGLVVADVSSPAAPAQVGSLALAGAQGLDVDAERQLAVVAQGGSGLSVVNVANPAAPALFATLPGGDVRDVAISGNYAFLADVSRSFTAVDLTNPAAPVLRASTPRENGGLLEDVAVVGNVAAGADVFFVNGVPLIDVTNPGSPQPRLILDFRSYGDDNGTGIAMDPSYVYLTTDRARLFIGQYNLIQDTFGIPPSIEITSPATGTTVIQGSTLTVTANATDDVAVASVSFLVDGQEALRDTSVPYELTLNVPANVTSFSLGATAVDLGENVGTATPVALNVIPDPLTTVMGRVIDSSSAPVSGVTLATAGGRSGSSAADGSFSITGVPTIQGTIIVTASFTSPTGTLLGGTSPTIPAVRGGITNVGDLRILPLPQITSVSPRQAISGTTVPNFQITGANLTDSTFSFTPLSSPPAITVTSAVIDPSGTSATLSLTIAANAQGAFVARATNAVGSSDWFISGNNSLRVLNLDPTADADADGLSNADEVARGTDIFNPDTDGDGFPDGMEVALGSNPLVASSIPNTQSPGEVVSLTFSVLNGTSPAEPTSMEADSLTFSTLNGFLPGGQSTLTEADSLLFSVENLSSSAPVPLTSPASSQSKSSLLSATNPASTRSKASKIVASLYYPRRTGDASAARESRDSMGIAVVNLNTTSETLTFTAFDDSGNSVTGPRIKNPASWTLEPGRQLAMAANEIFGLEPADREEITWIRLENPTGKIVGFFLMFNEKLTVLDGADITATSLSSFVLPEIEDEGFTLIHIANPNADAVDLRLELLKPDGSLRTGRPVIRRLNANAAIAESFDVLFPGVAPAGSDYIRITATKGVLPFELLGKGDEYVEGLNGQDAYAGAATLYSPHYAAGDGEYRSTLSIVNLDSTGGTVNLELIGNDGQPIAGRKDIPIPAKGKIRISDQNFFARSGNAVKEGYVKITSDGVRLTGSVVFGDRDRNRFSTALPLVSTLGSSVVFSHVVSNETYFTGIAIVNPNGVEVKAAIEIYNSDGTLALSKVEKIPARQRKARLLTEFFPDLVGQDRRSGYIRIKADKPFASFAVFGTNDLKALSAIPAQVVP